jgi:hypothetical protein
MTTNTKTAKKPKEKENAEKPISLSGASFTDVLAALLKTEPMPKPSKKKLNQDK